MDTKKGQLIVIEGLDGSGKTVQWKMLAQHLKDAGHHIHMVDFPQYSKASSGLINSYLRDIYGKADSVSPYAASLFYALDRFDLAFNEKGNMREWLDDGRIVLANRYVASNGGHQGGKIADETELRKFLSWLFDTEYNILGIPKPDINVFLDVPFEFSKKLREQRAATLTDSHEANEQHLIDAERAYRFMVREFPQDFVVIQCVENGALLSKETIHEKVKKAIFEKLGL